MSNRNLYRWRIWLALLPALCLIGVKAAAFDHFVTADHGVLKDGTKVLRFVSFNVPNLNYTEDDMRFRQTNPYRLPTEYEMRDLFATINQMGGQVVRIYTIPVKNAAFPPDAPTYVEAPGKFNEEAFRRLDLMMALANEYHVRIIFPLVNNWPWMGGRPQYAAFRGKTPDEFWTDPQLIADFEATIRFLLERTNTVTGVKYKNDKAILCWETGNELSAPFGWTVRITRFIKSLDENHLVMDGSSNVSNQHPSVQPGALTEPSIDIVTTHHYESDPAVIPGHIQDAIDAINRRKVYIVGEFGFAPEAANEAIIDKVIAGGVSGALVWSLRFHDQDGGFYWHAEPEGANVYKAFHWPGFASGAAYEEEAMMAMIRRKAYAIRGLTPPRLPRPPAPVLLPINSVGTISWRGSAGATGYDIERAPAARGPWLRIARNASDADVPYFPLYDDESAAIGERYYYRVRAVNGAGVSPRSNVVGPVDVTFKLKLDTMKDLSRAESASGITPAMGNDRSFKEIRNRLTGGAGAELVYAVPGRLKSFDLYDFERAAADALVILGSDDDKTWQVLHPDLMSYADQETNYDYWVPKIYHCDGDATVKHIKIVFKGGAAQLARAEIAYTGD